MPRVHECRLLRVDGVFWGSPTSPVDVPTQAEEYADEDKKVKERIDARNGLESYLYNMYGTVSFYPLLLLR